VTAGKPRLLAYRALGIGDLLVAVPVLRALARAFPDHHRVLATPAALAPIARLSGGVDELLDVAALAPLPASAGGAEVAVNLHGRGPQSHRVLLAAAPERIVAFANAEAGVDGPEWRPGEHEAERLCRLLRESGIPADRTEVDLARPDWPAPPGAAGATLVHPGASTVAKRWPPERWAAVARAERAAGRGVVVTGSAGERELAEEVARGAGIEPECVLAGRTDLAGLAAAAAVAARVACADTGVAHLATAFGTPSVVVFGPVSPALWGPPPGRPQHRVLWSGRSGDADAERTDPGLLEIEVDAVLAALAALPPSNLAPTPASAAQPTAFPGQTTGRARGAVAPDLGHGWPGAPRPAAAGAIAREGDRRAGNARSMERREDDDLEPASFDPADFPGLSTEPERVAPDEMPDPPNDLDGPEEEPPHLERGSPREGSNAGLDDPSPNVP